MASVNNSDEDLGKVFAVRRRPRRPTEIWRTQRSSSVTDWHEANSSISADINYAAALPLQVLLPSNCSAVHPDSVTSEPGLDVSTNVEVSSARYPCGVSSSCEVSDPGTMPLAGPSMEVAIARLLAILQAIYRHDQHKEDLDRLTLRLHRLVNWYLWNIATAQDPCEQARRDSLVRTMQETSAQLKILLQCGLSYTSVVQAIARCSIEIDRYLLGCLWFQMQQSKNDMHDMQEGRQSHEHPVPVNFYTSFQQLNRMLQVLFERDSIAARNNVIEEGHYDLSIDKGTRFIQPTSHEWPSIEAGTMTVMRVIFEQQVTSGVDYQCHFCGAVNRLGVETIMHLLQLFQHQAGCSIDCQICKRRFQISHVPATTERGPRRVPRGSLHDYLKRNHFNLSERQKSDILFGVADGIKYLHKQGIVHGNLTGDTIFCDDSGRVRIADNQIFSAQHPGDARYIAPESITRGFRTEAPRPSKAGDIYSYGCVAILVLSGKLPYWWIFEEGRVLLEKLKGTEPFGQIVEMDEVQLNLVRQCLSGEKSRPSIEKVRYLVLVQGFGAVDLTNSVQRLNKDHQSTGGFANVHRCKLHVRDIDTSVQRLVSPYQFSSITSCDDVAVKEIKFGENPDVLKIINQLFREIKLWLKLEHENIVPLLGVTDGFSSLPALVSPWFQNGTLTGYLQRKHKMLSHNAKFALVRSFILLYPPR